MDTYRAGFNRWQPQRSQVPISIKSTTMLFRKFVTTERKKKLTEDAILTRMGLSQESGGFKTEHQVIQL